MRSPGEQWFVPVFASEAIRGWTEPHVHEVIRANFWWVRGRDRDMVIDSGCGIVSLRSELPEMFDNDPILVCTHGHCDHVGGATEFNDRAIHREEANLLVTPELASLRAGDHPLDYREMLAGCGLLLTPLLLDTVPHSGFDVDHFAVQPAPPTRLLTAGDTIDLGDQMFTVIHLPGHSPGSIALHDEHTGTLFSGDVIYDGPLLDALPESDRDQYRDTMRVLRSLPVTTVHAGHGTSFNHARLCHLADGYLDRRGNR